MMHPIETETFTRMTDGSTLVIQRWLPGPAERVWRYLCDDTLRRKWLAAGEMQPVRGEPLELVWRNDDLSAPNDPRPSAFATEQRMQSRVIDVEPMRMLKIAWGRGDVTFTLEEYAGRVLLTVTHCGLENSSERGMIAPGWHMHLDILVAEITDTQRPSFWSGWAKLKTLYENRFDQQG